MTKRTWKLYKEVRRLRRKVKQPEADCAEANFRWQGTLEDLGRWRQYIDELRRQQAEQPYDKIMLTIPNICGFEYIQDSRYVDKKPRAEYLMKRMTDTAKLKLVEDLIRGGYIKKVRDDEMCGMYEVKVIR